MEPRETFVQEELDAEMPEVDPIHRWEAEEGRLTDRLVLEEEARLLVSFWMLMLQGDVWITPFSWCWLVHSDGLNLTICGGLRHPFRVAG